MDLSQKIKELSNRIVQLKDSVATEEATKHSFVMPFLQALGYDVFDPTVIIPEYIADAGTKKHEKVDYAIMKDGKPLILIEVKKHSESLKNHDNQLFRYFSVSDNKFAILTNGIEYMFFAESEQNRMDTTPFLTIDLLNPKERDIKELERFAKDELDTEKIMSLAHKRKFIINIKDVFRDEIYNPSNEFAKFFASNILEGKRLTQNIVDEFKTYIKSSFKEIITDLATEKINAIKSGLSTETSGVENENEEENNGILTTEDEITGFFIIKSILASEIGLERVAARDTKSYFGVLLDDNNRKWICRLHFNSKQKYIGIHEKEKEESKYALEKVEDIYKYAENIKSVIKRLGAGEN